jgi:predicted  nucleic acid-binding Zn-ribbon protein
LRGKLDAQRAATEEARVSYRRAAGEVEEVRSLLGRRQEELTAVGARLMDADRRRAAAEAEATSVKRELAGAVAAATLGSQDERAALRQEFDRAEARATEERAIRVRLEAHVGAVEGEVAELRRRLASASDSATSLQREVSGLRTRAEGSESALASVERRVADVSAEAAALRDRVREGDAQLASLQRDYDALSRDYERATRERAQAAGARRELAKAYGDARQRIAFLEARATSLAQQMEGVRTAVALQDAVARLDGAPLRRGSGPAQPSPTRPPSSSSSASGSAASGSAPRPRSGSVPSALPPPSALGVPGGVRLAGGGAGEDAETGADFSSVTPRSVRSSVAGSTPRGPVSRLPADDGRTEWHAEPSARSVEADSDPLAGGSFAQLDASARLYRGTYHSFRGAPGSVEVTPRRTGAGVAASPRRV